VRLFVAVWPPPEVVRDLAALPRPSVEGVRWTTAEHWHVTLRFLGELPDAAGLCDALRAAPLARVSAAMGPLAERPSPMLLWLPVAGLDGLAAAVMAATAALGRREEPAFRGHLTLARARPRTPRGALRRLTPLALSASWDVEEVTVVRSATGGTGSRYEVVERFPTGP